MRETMNHMNRFSCMVQCLALVIATTVSCSRRMGEEETSRGPCVSVVLRTIQTNVEPRSLSVEMTVVNITNHAVRLPIPPSGIMEKNGSWCGWQFAIEGVDDDRCFNLAPPRRCSVQDSDIVTLAPGQTQTVAVGFAQAVEWVRKIGNYNFDGKRLGETPGRYKISVCYGLSDDAEGLIWATRFYRGPIFSNELIINVEPSTGGLGKGGTH